MPMPMKPSRIRSLGAANPRAGEERIIGPQATVRDVAKNCRRESEDMGLLQSLSVLIFRPTFSAALSFGWRKMEVGKQDGRNYSLF
jgi:hypothetical protein